jgi:hypothetical protein
VVGVMTSVVSQPVAQWFPPHIGWGLLWVAHAHAAAGTSAVGLAQLSDRVSADCCQPRHSAQL